MSRAKPLLFSLTLVAFSAGAGAAPLCTTFSNLQQLINQNGSGGCDYAGVNFNTWSYSRSVDNGANTGTPANVNVTFTTVGGNKPTVQFKETNSEFTIAGTGTTTGHQMDIRPGYRVSILAPSDPHALSGLMGISGIAEGATGLATWDYPTGTPTRNQALFKSRAAFADNSQPLPGGNQANPTLLLMISTNPGPNGPHVGGVGAMAPQTVCDNGLGPVLCSALNDNALIYKFFGVNAQGFIDGPKDISLSSGGGTLNAFDLKQFDEQFMEVIGPEPQTFVMFGAGLLALAMVGRKYQKHQNKAAK